MVQARGLVTALEKRSFGTDEISVLFPDGGSTASVRAARSGHSGRSSRSGALIGGTVGVLGGCALGLGALESSATLPLVSAGPFVAGTVLAMVGALVGSVVGPAFWRSRARNHGAQDPSTILVTVETRSQEATSSAERIFVSHGASEIQTHARGAA